MVSNMLLYVSVIAPTTVAATGFCFGDTFAVGFGSGVGVTFGDTFALGVASGVGESLGLSLGVGVAVGFAEIFGVGVAVGLALGSCVGVGFAEGTETLERFIASALSS